MNRRFGKIAVLSLALGGLVSCGGSSYSGTLGLNVTCPKGAPSLALVPFLSQSLDQVSITSPSNVAAAFSSASADAVIFDINKGSTLVTKKGMNYKLARVLTAGNAFVISTGKDANAAFDSDDSYVSFGTSSLFTVLFEQMHSIPAASVSEVADVSTAMSVAVTGLNEGNDVDYVILSEPFVTTALAKNASLSVKENLQTAYKAYSKEKGLNGGEGYATFPMAGIFIHDTVEADSAKADSINNFLAGIDDACHDYASNKGAKMIAQIKKDTEANLYDASSAATCLFGPLTLDSISKVVDEDQNGSKAADALGFVDGKFDYAAFSKEVLSAELPASLFSSFYKAA